jgi:hypothetical protein
MNSLPYVCIRQSDPQEVLYFLDFARISVLQSNLEPARVVDENTGPPGGLQRGIDVVSTMIIFPYFCLKFVTNLFGYSNDLYLTTSAPKILLIKVDLPVPLFPQIKIRSSSRLLGTPETVSQKVVLSSIMTLLRNIIRS